MTFLRRQVRERDIRELLFTADLIDAARAKEIGLVNRVVPPSELEAETQKIVAAVLQGAPGALMNAKRLMEQLWSTSVKEDIETALSHPHAGARVSRGERRASPRFSRSGRRSGLSSALAAMPKPLTVEAPAELLAYLFTQWPELKKKQIRTWLKFQADHGERPAGLAVRSSARARRRSGGRADRFAIPKTVLSSGMKVLFEDATLIVIDKPENLLSVASARRMRRRRTFS
jgi:hypothetical protein